MLANLFRCWLNSYTKLGECFLSNSGTQISVTLSLQFVTKESIHTMAFNTGNAAKKNWGFFQNKMP